MRCGFSSGTSGSSSCRTYTRTASPVRTASSGSSSTRSTRPRDIGSYKPADANFEYLLAHLGSDFGLDRSDVLHTAQSLHHDHVPANRFGLANAWIDRQRLSKGGSWGATDRVETMPTTDFVFFSMGEMAEAVAKCANAET